MDNQSDRRSTTTLNIAPSVTVSAVTPAARKEVSGGGGARSNAHHTPTATYQSQKKTQSASSAATPAAVAAAAPPPTDPFEALGLTDDSFIVEAPSFVVPYLIEKMAPKKLKTLVETIAPPTPAAPAKKADDVIVLSEDETSDSGDSASAVQDAKSPPAAATSTAPVVAPAAVAAPIKKEANKDADDYFSGAIGRFFLDIGLSLVQEYVQSDLLRVQKRKVYRGTKIHDPSLTVAALSKGTPATTFYTLLPHSSGAFKKFAKNWLIGRRLPNLEQT